MRIKLPRNGNNNQAVLDGLTCTVPCEIKQFWSASALNNAAVMHGFVYKVFSEGIEMKTVGPSTVYEEWGGRSNGILRIDGRVIMIPEFWERQPRSIYVSNDTITLTFLKEKSEPFRSGEDIIDRFVILNDTGMADDEWFFDAAIYRAEGVWRFHNGYDTASWNGDYGETRMASWPVLILINAYKETLNEKYWSKAKELFQNIYDQEIRSGAGGYITNASPYIGNINNAQSLMTFYSLRALLPFADMAIAKGEWQEEYTLMMVRTGIWLSTPIPEGVYVPDGSYLNPPDDITFGRYAYYFLPPGLSGTYPTSNTSGGVEIPYTIMASDIYAWLSVHDPGGINPVNNKTWREL